MKYDVENKYSWLTFAQSYLTIANAACENVLTGSKNSLTDPMNFEYRAAELFIPVVFNIKHGVEVFIKTLAFIIKDKYSRDVRHDIKSLFSTLKSIIPKDLKPFEGADGNKVTQEEIDQIPQSLQKLEELVLKYYHCDFVFKGRRVVDIYDRMNDLFRYPDDKAEIVIDLNLVDRELIGVIQNDIQNFYRVFNALGYIFDVSLQNSNNANQGK